MPPEFLMSLLIVLTLLQRHENAMKTTDNNENSIVANRVRVMYVCVCVYVRIHFSFNYASTCFPKLVSSKAPFMVYR